MLFVCFLFIALLGSLAQTFGIQFMKDRSSLNLDKCSLEIIITKLAFFELNERNDFDSLPFLRKSYSQEIMQNIFGCIYSEIKNSETLIGMRKTSFRSSNEFSWPNFSRALDPNKLTYEFMKKISNRMSFNKQIASLYNILNDIIVSKEQEIERLSEKYSFLQNKKCNYTLFYEKFFEALQLRYPDKLEKDCQSNLTLKYIDTSEIFFFTDKNSSSFINLFIEILPQEKEFVFLRMRLLSWISEKLEKCNQNIISCSEYIYRNLDFNRQKLSLESNLYISYFLNQRYEDAGHHLGVIFKILFDKSN